jgi:hypothetical protein
MGRLPPIRCPAAVLAARASANQPNPLDAITGRVTRQPRCNQKFRNITASVDDPVEA